MAKAYGTREFGTGDLEGLAEYLLQLRRSRKNKKKREVLKDYACIAQNAADRIVDLEHFKKTALRIEQES